MDINNFKIKGNKVYQVQKFINEYLAYINSERYHPRQYHQQEKFRYEGKINIKGNTWEFFEYADNIKDLKKKLIKGYHL